MRRISLSLMGRGKEMAIFSRLGFGWTLDGVPFKCWSGSYFQTFIASKMGEFIGCSDYDESTSSFQKNLTFFLRINDLEANNGIDESDVEEVLETLFDQPDDQKDKHSEDPFGLYPLLNKENIKLARKNSKRLGQSKYYVLPANGGCSILNLMEEACEVGHKLWVDNMAGAAIKDITEIIESTRRIWGLIDEFYVFLISVKRRLKGLVWDCGVESLRSGVGVLGDLVNEVQSAFVADRQILDGPFILDEVLQWCRRKKKLALIFKVDFEKKAIDSVYTLGFRG
ncbi:hypothetical protein Tco_1429292 [Tanacetum coccineum]